MSLFTILIPILLGPISSFAIEMENVCFVPPNEKVIAFGAEIKDSSTSTHFYINGDCNFKNKKCRSVIRTELNDKFGLANPSTRDFEITKVNEAKFVYTLKGKAGEELVIDAANQKISFKASSKAINYSIDQTVSCK